jgi:O-antigen/teichoic acid export membrane protein
MSAGTTKESIISLFFTLFRGTGLGAALARGASYALVIRLVSSGVAFGTQIVLARVLGTESFGIYAYATTWLLLLTLASLLGLHTTTIRFVSEYQGLHEWGLLRGYLQRSQQLTLLTSVAIAVVVAAAIHALRGWFGAEMTFAFDLVCLAIPAFALLHVQSAVLRGLKRIVASLVPIEIVRPVLIAVGALSLVLFAGARPGAPTALAINVAATLVALGLTATALRQSVPPEVHSKPAEHRSGEWVRVALPVWLVTGFSLVLSDIGIIMVGALLGPRQSGIYAAAVRLASLLSFGLIAVGTMAAPMIGELHAQGRRQELQRVLTLGARAAMAVALPVGLVLTIGGRLLLRLFGADFTEAYPSLLIIVVAQLVNSLTGSTLLLMLMTGDQNRAARILGISAAVNVALNAALILPFGIVGAATATSLANVACQLAMLRRVLRHHGLNPIAIGKGWRPQCRLGRR